MCRGPSSPIAYHPLSHSRWLIGSQLPPNPLRAPGRHQLIALGCAAVRQVALQAAELQPHSAPLRMASPSAAAAIQRDPRSGLRSAVDVHNRQAAGKSARMAAWIESRRHAQTVFQKDMPPQAATAPVQPAGRRAHLEALATRHRQRRSARRMAPTAAAPCPNARATATMEATPTSK